MAQHGGEAITWGQMLVAAGLAGGVVSLPFLGKLFASWFRGASNRQWRESRRELRAAERELGEERVSELVLLIELLGDDPRFEKAVNEMAALLRKRPRSEKAKKAHRSAQRKASMNFNKIVRDVIGQNESTLSAQTAETMLRKIKAQLKSGDLQKTLDAAENAEEHRTSTAPERLPHEEPEEESGQRVRSAQRSTTLKERKTKFTKSSLKELIREALEEMVLE